MSAYVPDKAHIAAMVRAGLDHATPGSPLRWWSEDPRVMVAGAADHADYFRRLEAIRRDLRHEPASVARAAMLLTTAVVAGVKHRYPDDTDETLPGPLDHYWTSTSPEAWVDAVRGARRLSVIEALSALDGYEYQACELPGWMGSEAASFVESLRRHLITRLPGYGSTWEVTDQAEVVA